MGSDPPPVCTKEWWSGKIIDWCMQNHEFKVQMFRFVDILFLWRT
ncbi:MAG: hypothetical protein HND49_10965 [Planctomycetes bacterium]|nr:hypothetical protein [Planctomycetota bacterium]